MESVSLAYFHAYQDEQTRGWSVYLMTARWLAVRVDFIIGVFIAILALSSIPLASSECGRTCEAHHVRHRVMGHVLSVHMPYIHTMYIHIMRTYVCMYVCVYIASLPETFHPSIPAVDAGLIGLSLSYTISLASLLQHGVRQAVEVENLVRNECIHSQPFCLERANIYSEMLSPLYLCTHV